MSPDPAALRALGFSTRPGGEARIPIPAQANIAADTVGHHASGARRAHPALVFEEASGAIRQWTFAELDEDANRLASSLARLGVGRGEPVGVHTGQRPESALMHLALYKLGAVACTMSQLYGPDTLAHIVADAGLRFVATRPDARAPLDAAIAQTGRTLTLLEALDPLVAAGEGAFHPAGNSANDPALLMYTSGSTGRPKGLVHGHRILHAYLPTVRMFYDGRMDEADAVFWTPADWAWVGGLLDLVLPAWAHGQTVVAAERRFDAESAFDLMARHRVTHSFMTPTALKRLAEITDPRTRWPVTLRVVCTGGESLPGRVVEWAESLGIVCNEFYGLTEFNHLVGNCRSLYAIVPGSMGRAYPGHGTTLVDEEGREVGADEVGEIVAPVDDPTLFLGYRGEPGIPAALRLGSWLRTRDLAKRDAKGYFWYQGRNDDLIKSAGYRIGPAEVEDALLKHPAVAEAAVVASPDAERGAIVKAFVRLKQGFAGEAALVRALQDMVRHDLAAYKYPREIEFVDSFPLTSSGKIRRGELRRREEETKRARGTAP